MFSKWVIQHTVGKVAESTFQRYKVRTNQSLDRKVMAPGSRGVGAFFFFFFRVFPAKIPAKRGMLPAN